MLKVSAVRIVELQIVHVKSARAKPVLVLPAQSNNGITKLKVKAALSGAALISFTHKNFMKTIFKTIALTFLSFVLLLALLSLMNAPVSQAASHSASHGKIF